MYLHGDRTQESGLIGSLCILAINNVRSKVAHAFGSKYGETMAANQELLIMVKLLETKPPFYAKVLLVAFLLS